MATPRQEFERQEKMADLIPHAVADWAPQCLQVKFLSTETGKDHGTVW